MAYRFQAFSGTPPTLGTPTAGGPVDWISGGSPGSDGAPNYRTGHAFRMDTGGAFSTGDDLATDGNGRAVQAGAGDTVVARALEGSSEAGDTAWCAIAGRRTA